MQTTSTATAVTEVPFLHDMDSCERDAYGDPARFAALVQVRYPHMYAARRSEVVADYCNQQRIARDAAARTAKAARAKRREPFIVIASWIFFLAFAVLHFVR